eukprot:1141838-Pelagomonas_calceolata.AAC.1
MNVTDTRPGVQTGGRPRKGYRFILSKLEGSEMQPLGEGEGGAPHRVPEPIERDEELQLQLSMEDVAARAACWERGPQLPAEEGGAGAGEGAQAHCGSKMLHQGRGRGRAGVSEPMEVSQDTTESTNGGGERFRATSFMHAKTQHFANLTFWRTS